VTSFKDNPLPLRRKQGFPERSQEEWHLERRLAEFGTSDSLMVASVVDDTQYGNLELAAKINFAVYFSKFVNAFFVNCIFKHFSWEASSLANNTKKFQKCQCKGLYIFAHNIARYKKIYWWFWAMGFYEQPRKALNKIQPKVCWDF